MSPILSFPNGEFLWVTGIEDTFIAHPHPKTARVLDEYLLTEHYDRWEEDLRLAADLGVQAIRYGIPWYRVEPEKGRFDWSWTDRVITTLVEKYKIEPIIDLVHYGTPLWLKHSFLSPDYAEAVENYARAFAEHYRGLCYWYTPLNEPRINAYYAGYLGQWPPYARRWEGFSKILLQIAKGICLTQRAIENVEKEAVFVHVDASDFYYAHDPEDERAVEEAQFRENIVYLALDLVTGRVSNHHALFDWMSRMTGDDDFASWFSERKVTPDIIGFNMYPMYSRKEVVRGSAGKVQIKIRPCWTETLLHIGKQYAARFSGIPLMVSETASAGAIHRRIRWIEESTRAILDERQAGVPYIGYTFWPLFSLITWAYRAGKRDIGKYLLHMGLYDLKGGEEGLERVWTPAVQAYERVIAGTRVIGGTEESTPSEPRDARDDNRM